MRPLLILSLCLAAPLILRTTWADQEAPNETRRYAALMTEVVNIPPGTPIAADEAREYQVVPPAGRAVGPRAQHPRTLLFLEIRMESPTHGGCNYGMDITVNGQDLGSALDRTAPRLIGKQPMAYVKNYPGAEGPWKRGNSWLLMYAPDFADHTIVGGDDCVFLWDVTDLLRHDGTDTVRLESQTKRLEEITKAKLPLVIGRFQMGLVNPKLLRPRLGAPLPVPPVAGKCRLAGQGFSAWLAPGGGLAVAIGRESFLLRSRFSYPGQPKGGWNTLEPARRPTGEVIWKPALTRSTSGTLTVRASTRTYTLSREVRVAGHRLLVRDTFRNRTDQIIGLRFRTEIDCTGKPVPEAEISGDRGTDYVYDASSADNPTLFVRPGKAGLGMLAEDDVYRVQCEIAFRYPLGSMGDTHFGLAPRASYTVEWALYPTASGDCWDFLNQVRRDWRVNFTIPAGSFWADCSTVTGMTDADLRQFLEWSGAKWAMLTPWLDCYPLPTRPTREEIVRVANEAGAKLHRAAPDAKLLLGTHPTMNFAIPGRGYDGPEYQDSFILDAEGKHFWTPPYTNYFVVGIAKEQGWLNFCNYMTPGNSYYHKMTAEADWALGVAKADGIYCDEFNHYNCVSPRTYGQWDQHYVELDDSTFGVKPGPRIALLSLVTDEAQELYARNIMRQGVFLANAQPVTRRLQNLHFPRFCESPDPRRGLHCALFSPLVYGNPPLPADEAGLFQFIRDRVLYCAVTHLGGMPKLTRPCVTAQMFPFTPVDIRPGLLTGEERIISTRSGAFGWPGEFRARLYLYDQAGVLTQADPPVRLYRSKCKLTVPAKGMAILVRVS
jgi:hypothetical protein